jgi:RIO kinase 1
MPRINLNQYFDENWEVVRNSKQRHKKRSIRTTRPPSAVESEVENAPEEFDFSYNASRHERGWLLNSLGDFYDQQWISDVLHLIKGGKEASVYQCVADIQLQSDPQTNYIAAKVYRPRRFRSLKNDSLYREGRQHLDSDGRPINDDGMLHAIHKRTAYGRELMHSSWIEHEFQALKTLHAAGADVPTPYASDNNAILMGYIGDANTAASILNGIHLTHNDALQLFQRTIFNIEIMLANGMVHGDLSAFNILYWEGKITLIDFPQVVQPGQNRNAYPIFQRDVERVCEYFQRQGVKSDARRLAEDMWESYGNRLNPEIDVRFLDDENKEDRNYYEKWNSS